MSNVLFGSSEIYYADLGISLAKLSEHLLMSEMVDLSSIVLKDNALRVLFYWIFNLLATYTLINIFIAIICDKYASVSEEVGDGRSFLSELADMSRISAVNAAVKTERALGRGRPARLLTDLQVWEVLRGMQPRPAAGGSRLVSGGDVARALRARHPGLPENAAYRCPPPPPAPRSLELDPRPSSETKTRGRGHPRQLGGPNRAANAPHGERRRQRGELERRKRARARGATPGAARGQGPTRRSCGASGPSRRERLARLEGMLRAHLQRGAADAAAGAAAGDVDVSDDVGSGRETAQDA
eukprot:tig00021365_g20815.t1